MKLAIDRNLRWLLRQALEEDLGKGDMTTRALIPKNLAGEAEIIAKQSGVFCSGPVAREVFQLRDSSLRVKLLVEDGARIRRGRRVLSVRGRVRSILEAERVALNFLAHLSGIATLTRAFVEKTKGTNAKIFDTRKTTPLWRTLEKYAVRSGGGENHRLGLWDEVLVKDNHWTALWDILDRTRCRYFGQRLKPIRKRGIPIEVEVRNLKELAHLLEGQFVPDRILLDNFSLRELQRAVLFVKGLYHILQTRYGIHRKKPELEASGGITLENVRPMAATGVQRISIGRLTHSAPALDFSLRLVL